MLLSEIHTNDVFTVTAVPAGMVKAQAIRLGIFEGAVLKCSYKINRGPIILEKHRQEIAVGHSIAQKIKVNKNEEVQYLGKNSAKECHEYKIIRKRRFEK